jgi:hypothetical protein
MNGRRSTGSWAWTDSATDRHATQQGAAIIGGAYHGGCSSTVERLTVDQKAAGSSPVSHPSAFGCKGASPTKGMTSPARAVCSPAPLARKAIGAEDPGRYNRSD